MTFNQQGQHVTTQYNAGRDINLGGKQTSEDITTLLEALKQQIVQAREQGILDEDASTDAEYRIIKAQQQAKKPKPDKKSILDYLKSAQKVVEGVASAGGLVAAIVQVVETAQKVF